MSLKYLSQYIWLWCIDHRVSSNALHIPGLDNQIANAMSCKFSDNIEWSLDTDIFHHLCQDFGTPHIDLYASGLNRKLNRYFSWRPDPFSCGVNAFAHKWDNIYGYAFPPFNQISKILYKVTYHSEADPEIKLTAAQHKTHISKRAWSKGCAVPTPMFLPVAYIYDFCGICFSSSNPPISYNSLHSMKYDSEHTVITTALL